MELSTTLAAGYMDLTVDRASSTLAALVALVGVVVGVRALIRARRGRPGTTESRIAVAAGVVGLAVGALVLATADGGPGTGNGVIGAGMAIVLGALSAGLGVVGIRRAPRDDNAGSAPERS